MPTTGSRSFGLSQRRQLNALKRPALRKPTPRDLRPQTMTLNALRPSQSMLPIPCPGNARQILTLRASLRTSSHAWET